VDTGDPGILLTYINSLLAPNALFRHCSGQWCWTIHTGTCILLL